MSDVFAQVKVPAQAKYILPIRLFLAGIAVRMDFPAETIEDIKMAAAEACSILMAGAAEAEALCCNTAEQADHSLRIDLCLEGKVLPGEADDISRAILEAMADECTFNYQQGVCRGITICFKN